MSKSLKDVEKIRRVLLAVIDGQNWKKIAAREGMNFSVVSTWRVKYLRKLKVFTLNEKGKKLLNGDQKELF